MHRSGPPGDALLAAMLDQADAPLAFLDPAFVLLRVSRAFAANAATTPEALEGRPYFDTFPSPEVQARFEAVRASGRAAEFHEAPFEPPGRPGQGVTYWNWTLTPARDGAGALLGYVLTARDVTELVRARRRAEASEALALERATELQAVLDAVPAAIFFARDPACAEITGNAQAQRLLGLEPGRNLSKTAPSTERPAYLPRRDGREVPPEELPMQRAARLGVEVRDEEYEMVLADGSRRWILGGATPVRIGDEVRGAVGAFVDITARKAAERALAEAARHKDEFLAMLSHELRNPLAPIRNAVALLDLAPAGGEVAQRAQTILRRQVTHLARLVDDLLDVTRIASGKVELRREPVEVGAALRRAAEDHRSTFAARGVALELALPDEALWVDGDPTRLAQVLGNLLHNAAKFGRDGGRVTVAARADGAAVELRVTDDGEGIDPGLLDRVFDPFVQAERSLARSQGGLGLGLALVRGLTEVHGGTVRAESAGPGHGATFVVRLPAVA